MGIQFLTDVGLVFPSGAFSPSDLANIRLWLKADAITGLNDNDNISTWEDSSANGYDVTQGTGTKQPTYQTNELNSLPVVRFDGGDTLTNMTSIMSADPSFTVFAVAKSSDWDAATNDVLNIGDDFTQAFILRTQSSNTMKVWQPNTNNLTTGTITDSNWYYFSYTYNASTNAAELFLDGVSADTATISGIDPDKTYIGSFIDSFYFTGDIAEVIVYEQELSDTDRESVENYLATKYNL